METIFEKWELREVVTEGHNQRLLRVRRDNDSCLLRIMENQDESSIDPQYWQPFMARYHELKTPYLLNIREISRQGGRLLIEYDDFPAVTLSQLLCSISLSLEQKCSIAIALTKAIADLHRQQCVLFYLTPDVILISPDDYSLRFYDLIRAEIAHTNAGLVRALNDVRELAYISPEQSGRTNITLDYRSDLYALGVILYQLFAEVLPFYSEDPNNLVYQHLATLPKPPSTVAPELPSVLNRIVLKLLAKSPDDRYQMHGVLLADLEQCLHALESEKSIPDFAIAQSDTSNLLTLSPKLYDREVELGKLLGYFKNVAAGGCELVLLGGYSGIGKSRLIKELSKTIKKRDGFYVEGKFDQFKRDIPYSALAEALSGLTHHVLSIPDQTFVHWQHRLRNALGSNGSFLAALLPELELIVGPQPALPALSAVETESRIKAAFISFLNAFASDAHPLVLFLDDVQWADSASFKLIESLAMDDNEHFVMLVAAYRDNEVDVAHPLTRMRQNLQEQGRSPRSISLNPLSQFSVSQLIADSLQLAPEEVTELASILYQKTQGNPFFLIRYLTQLYEDDVIYYQRNARRWCWDEKKINTMYLADNVVELLSAKIRAYPAAACQLLMMASLLGTRFRLEALALIVGMDQETCLQQLTPVLQDGLLLPLDDNYKQAANSRKQAMALFKFPHDRIQQAAHEIVVAEHENIALLKLDIGRTLLTLERKKNSSEPSFDIIEHINYGKHYVVDVQERLDFARLNLDLSLQAKRSAAFRPAWQYLQAAQFFLALDLAHAETSLAINIYRELAECAYLDGEFALAEIQYPLLEQMTTQAIDKIRYLSVQANQYQLQGRFREALDIINQGIALVGVTFPTDEQELLKKINQEYVLVQAEFTSRPSQELLLRREMEDEVLIAAMELMRVQWYASYLVGDVALNSLISITISRLSLQQGFCDVSAFGFVTSALIASGMQSDAAFSKILGEFAIELADARSNMSIRGTVYLLYTTFTRHWHHPVQSSEKYFRIAWECSVETSDYVTAGYVINVRSTDRLIAGRALPELEGLYRQEIEYLKKVKQKDMEDATYAGGLQPVLALTGKTDSPYSFDDAHFSEQAFLQSYSDTGLHQAYFYQARMRHAFIMQAPDCAELADKYVLVEQYVPGQCKVSEAHFYGALIHLQLATENDAELHLNVARSIRAKFEQWQQNCTANFLHKLLLIDAEIARVTGADMDAQTLYEQALTESERAGFVQCSAVICERYAQYLRSRNLQKSANIFINQSYHCYSLWGATVKLQQLVSQWPQLRFEQQKTGVPVLEGQILDEQALFKAAALISGKVKRNELADTLLQLLKEFSGATYGALVQVDNRKLSLLAHTDGSEGSNVIVQSNQMDIFQAEIQQLVPANIISYVHKTQITRVMNNPGEWDDWGASPYFNQRRPLSIICHPIAGQSGIIAILYLENQLTINAFSSRKSQAVSLIAQQAAIAIENAGLYEQMEFRIERRTQELAVAKLKAEEATDAKSNFLAKMSHEIRTPMNAVIGLSRLALKSTRDAGQRDFLGKILESAEVLLNLINDILDFSKIEAGKLNLESVAFETEQLVQRAVNLVALKAYAKGLELAIDIDPDLPLTLKGDPLRLQQILVNLISNAVKFTEQGTIHIKLECRNETARKVMLECSIIDTGIGMSAEQQGKLFQSFTQADDSYTRKYGGTGLGLAICKQLCELMGGRVWLESDVGKGTRFHFTVTLDKGEGPVSTLPLDRARFAHLRGLVVDDVPLVRNVILGLLDDMGIAVEQADSGSAAIDRIHKALASDAPFDFILLDWNMPGMDGVETSQRIQQLQLGNAPHIFMIPAYDREAIKGKLEGAIMHRVLEKPVSPSLLQDAIIRALMLDGEAPLDTADQVPEAVPDLSGYRILLVEDNAINRQVTQGLLEDTGITIDHAHNGIQALDMLDQQAYDLIFMDIQMPEMDGLTATVQIRQRLRLQSLPIIAMTAHAMESDVEKSRVAGMNAHISKPLNPEELFQLLLQFLPARGVQFTAPVQVPENPDAPLLERLSTIKELDTSTAVRKLNGKVILYENLVRDFVQENRERAPQMHNLHNQHDRATLNRLAHSLRSSAAYIGAFDLALASETLELALDQGEASVMQLEAVTGKLEALVRQLEPLLPRTETASKQMAQTDGNLRHLLVQLLPLLKRSDLVVERYLATLEQLGTNIGLADRVEDIVRNIRNIEYEEAAAMTAELLAQLEG